MSLRSAVRRQRTTAIPATSGEPDPVVVLAGLRALQAARNDRRPATPAELAQRIIPNYRVTPAVKLISDVLTAAITRPDGRYIITTPPRTGKSVLVSQIGVPFALAHNPDAKIILAAYGDSLAEEHSREARRYITEHADLLGFTLATDKQAVGRWRVEGRQGGLLAAGILSGITGHGADLILIDDPVKNQQEADSAAHRHRVISEWRSTLSTRLHPGGSVVIVQTRWHPSDLAGTLLAEEPERWTHVNVPAIAEAGVPDALHRPPGVAMTSALGRTAEEFADIKKSVGSRAWYSLFQGVPASPEGNLIKRDWIDGHRQIAAPRGPTLTVVGVDPADSGEGDETGIVGAMLGRDGTISLTHDVSARLTSDAWCNRAVELAIGIGASRIVVEGYATATTYVRLLREAVTAAQPPHHISVEPWTGKGDALARAQGLIAALETGACRVAGQLDPFESDAVGWQAGQHCPDSVAAAVCAYESLVKAAGMKVSIAAPMGGSIRDGQGPRRHLLGMGAGAEQAPAFAGAVTDRATVTSLSGYLARRVDRRVV